MNNLMMFENKEVEVFELNGQVLFNPKNVAECLGIKNVNDNLRNFGENQVVKLKNSDIGITDFRYFRKLNNAGENFLTESGVYKLIFKSRKAEAEKFQDWVTSEVLPSIRKHGAYMTDETLEEALTSPDFLIRLATELKKEKEGRLLAEQKVEKQKGIIIELRPQAEIGDRFTNSDKLFDMNTLSKALNVEGMGRNNLFKFLRNNEILMKNNQPYQDYIDYFKVNVFFNENTERMMSKTVVKAKGINFIVKQLMKHKYIINKTPSEILDELEQMQNVI